MAVALRFIGLLLLITLGACMKTEVHRGAAATAPPKSSSGEYTVRPGDTLYSIAKRYGIDYHLLAERNHLSQPYTIYNGQKLQLWRSLPSSQVAWVYKVRPGDTLYSIAKRLGIDYHLLARRNRLPYPYTIYVGQELHLAGTAPMPGNLPGVRDEKSTSPTHGVAGASATKARPPASGQTTMPTSGKVPGFGWPLRGTITSVFGSRGGRMHDGIDIGAKEGTPITAAADGEVVYSDHRLSGYGNLIILRHSGNVFTAYAHNQRNLVRKGERVKRGDTIARVGQTGRASGPHLHFEVRRGSTPVDPLAYLPRR